MNIGLKFIDSLTSCELYTILQLVKFIEQILKSLTS